MSFVGYLSYNFGLLIVIAGLSVLFYMDVHLERRMVRQLEITNILLVVYSAFSYIEDYLGNRANYSPLRAWFSAIDYSLLTAIIVSIIMIVYPGHKKYLFIPLAVNTALVFLSIPSELVFYFNEQNSFQRGPLGFVPFIIDVIYILYLQFRLYKSLRWEKKELLHLAYMSFTAFLCVIIPLYFPTQSDQWLLVIISIDLLMYYVFLLQRYTKRDPLTGLLNRQCYYNDLEKQKESITALIAIDMNGLKQINDGEGHAEGDKALKTIADCFLRATNRKYSVYRIGGDEFTVICNNTNEDVVRNLSLNIKHELEKTEYSCAIGYAMKEADMTADDLYSKADKMLYENKSEYYKQKSIDRLKP